MMVKKILLVGFLCLSLVSSYGQVKTIGTIDLYGSKTYTKDQIKQLINLKEGDSVPQISHIENKLLQIKGVKKAHVKIICCEFEQPILFIGIAEDLKDTVKWNVINGRPYHLPDTLVKLHDLFAQAMRSAVLKNDNKDDFSEGHSLFRNAETRAYQLKFKHLADVYFSELKTVLLRSALPDQRERAAVIIAYATNKAEVAKIYAKAVYDPSPSVRNNVFRALTGIAVYQKTHSLVKMPGLDLFPKMLNSLYWSDRDKAMFALLAVTETKNPALMKTLRNESLSSLLEMAKWKSSGHAILAYALLGRIMGMNEEDVFKSWSDGNKEILFNKIKS